MSAGRRTQTEPTMVIPRDRLPPVSTIPGPTIEQLADIQRARRDIEPPAAEPDLDEPGDEP